MGRWHTGTARAIPMRRNPPNRIMVHGHDLLGTSGNRGFTTRRASSRDKNQAVARCRDDAAVPEWVDPVQPGGASTQPAELRRRS